MEAVKGGVATDATGALLRAYWTDRTRLISGAVTVTVNGMLFGTTFPLVGEVIEYGSAPVTIGVPPEPGPGTTTTGATPPELAQSCTG